MKKKIVFCHRGDKITRLDGTPQSDSQTGFGKQALNCTGAISVEKKIAIVKTAHPQPGPLYQSMAREETATCLACNKKCKQNDNSAQCMVCRLWVHKTFAGMPDGMFNILEDSTSWWEQLIRPVGHARHMPREWITGYEIESKLAEVKQSCSKEEGDIKKSGIGGKEANGESSSRQNS